jgi:hypothetical protein
MKVINLKNYGVIVLNTELTKEMLLKLKKHNPKALKLQDEEGNDIFGLSFAEEASVTKYGISFNKEDSEGKALVTIQATMTNEEIAEEYADILMKTKIIEEKAIEAYEELAEQLLEIANSIENS